MSLSASDFIRTPELPWTVNQEDENRFRKILTVLLGFLLLMSITVTVIDLPELTREEERVIQVQAAEVIKKKEVKKPKPKPKPKVEQQQKKVKPKPVKPTTQKQKVTNARNNAKKRLSQVSNELSGMKSSLNLASIHASKNISSGGRIGIKGTRAIITSKNAAGTSGGIVTSNVSRGVGGGGLAGRMTTRVYSDSAEGGTGLGGNGAGRSGGGGGDTGGRNIEQLRRVFDRNKGTLTRIYLREAKKDPSLEGTVVLNLVIEPSGAVSKCRVVSSELKNKKLENKIASRCKLFDFGAEDVKTTKVDFPVTFLPY